MSIYQNMHSIDMSILVTWRIPSWCIASGLSSLRDWLYSILLQEYIYVMSASCTFGLLTLFTLIISKFIEYWFYRLTFIRKTHHFSSSWIAYQICAYDRKWSVQMFLFTDCTPGFLMGFVFRSQVFCRRWFFVALSVCLPLRCFDIHLVIIISLPFF